MRREETVLPENALCFPAFEKMQKISGLVHIASHHRP